MDLIVLDNQIDARVRQTLEQYPDWPCRRGCDECCRSLTRPPLVARPEWDRIHAALQSLEHTVRSAVYARIRAEWDRVCPLLDPESGECLVYATRPVACRTYGFYADREAGLYCGRISALAASGELDQVVWGNQESIDHTLDKAGHRRTFAAWLDG